MESDWIEYKCKSGKIMFIYNKVTGVHKWPPGFNNGSSEDSIMYGQPVEYKESHSIATQTDDYGCNNGCTSMYINTDPHHVSNISETLPQPQPGVSVDGEHDLDNEHDPETLPQPQLGVSVDGEHDLDNEHDLETLPQPQPGVSVDGEHDFDNKHDPANTLEDEDEQEQNQYMDEVRPMLRVVEEFSTGNDLAEKENEAKDDSTGDDNTETRLLHETEGQHSEESLKCSYCAKQFKYKSTLIEHLRIHTGEKPFECSHCEKKFARNGSLREHLKIHTGEKPFRCSYCEKTFTRNCYLTRHIRTHTRETASRLSNLQSQDMDETFSVPSMLEKDAFYPGYNNSVKANISEKDDSAGNHQGNKKQLYKTINTSRVSEELSEEFSPVNNLVENENEGVDKSSSLEEAEISPVNSLVEKENEAKNDSACDDNVVKRQLHEKEGRSYKKSKKPLKCSYCSKELRNKSALNTHLRTHTGEKPFECSLCKTKFSKKVNLKRHFRIHTGEKPFECSECKYKFTQKSDLKKHLKIHTREKPFECSYCENKFAIKTHLTRHLRTHTDGEKTYDCSFCKKKFRHRFILKSHLALH